MEKTIGKIVRIKNDATIWYSGEWGIIKGMDNGCYLIAIANGKDQVLFNREDFKIARDQTNPPS